MRDAGHDGTAAGPKTSGSLTGTAKLTSSSRYADIISKVSGPAVVLSCDCHSRAAIIPAVTPGLPSFRRRNRDAARRHRPMWPSCLPLPH